MSDEKSKLEADFRKFKKKYFKGKTSFSGIELENCKSEFWKQYKLKEKK